jgi:Zn-dependent peptidase ImmA (M78 family)
VASHTLDTGTTSAIRATAEAVLARYPAGLDRTRLLAVICRDEGIEVLDADLWDIRGVLRREEAGWRIYLSRQDAPHRRLLTLAHLLGHFFLHGSMQQTFVEGPFVTDAGRSAESLN